MARGSCAKCRVAGGGVGLVFGSLAARHTVIPECFEVLTKNISGTQLIPEEHSGSRLFASLRPG